MDILIRSWLGWFKTLKTIIKKEEKNWEVRIFGQLPHCVWGGMSVEAWGEEVIKVRQEPG